VAYWLMKSEPGAYSWADLVRDGRTGWDGVRNHQAANNMKAMKVGDRAFFYHSGGERTIEGVMAVSRAYHADPSDESGRFGMVEVKPLRPVRHRVSLAEIKAEPALAGLALVRQSRLSVMPVGEAEWKRLSAMAGIEA